MDAERLSSDVDCVSSNGIVLSVEQKAQLHTSLALLKHKSKFRHVQMWGIVRGVDGDYFIAVGVGRDELRDRKYLFSQDCQTWADLPRVDQAMKESSQKLLGRFTGRPDHVYKNNVMEIIGEEPNSQEQTSTIEMKEVDRLATVVALIQEEAAVVPKGAYIQTQTGAVVLNNSFQGLSYAEVSLLSYYQHFFPKDPTIKPPSSDVQKLFEFQEMIESDIPNGCWSVLQEHGGKTVILRSLLWLGMVAYHIPQTSSFGYFYSGGGEKNRDLLFML